MAANAKMTGRFTAELNGQVVAAGENKVVSDGVDHILDFKPGAGGPTVTIPWPADGDGVPLPLELALHRLPGRPYRSHDQGAS
jgi:hypothetical protein